MSLDMFYKGQNGLVKHQVTLIKSILGNNSGLFYHGKHIKVDRLLNLKMKIKLSIP